MKKMTEGFKQHCTLAEDEELNNNLTCKTQDQLKEAQSWAKLSSQYANMGQRFANLAATHMSGNTKLSLATLKNANLMFYRAGKASRKSIIKLHNVALQRKMETVQETDETDTVEQDVPRNESYLKDFEEAEEIVADISEVDSTAETEEIIDAALLKEFMEDNFTDTIFPQAVPKALSVSHNPSKLTPYEIRQAVKKTKTLTIMQIQNSVRMTAPIVHHLLGTEVLKRVRFTGKVLEVSSAKGEPFYIVGDGTGEISVFYKNEFIGDAYSRSSVLKQKLRFENENDYYAQGAQNLHRHVCSQLLKNAADCKVSRGTRVSVTGNISDRWSCKVIYATRITNMDFPQGNLHKMARDRMQNWIKEINK